MLRPWGANHLGRCDGGFLSPAGLVTRRYPMLRHSVAFSGSAAVSACGNNRPSWGTELYIKVGAMFSLTPCPPMRVCCSRQHDIYYTYPI